MKKIDYRKEMKELYAPSAKQVGLVEVPAMNYLMIDGKGDPNKAVAFQQAVEALYGVSYTLKFMIKKGPAAIDYGVMPLEGLWWIEEMAEFSIERKDDWLWTVMIMQPAPVTEALVKQAIEEVRKKKNPPALSLMRYESLAEGKAAQIMHLGPFATEGPTIEKVHAFIREQGGKLRGKHHEIYLSDIRKAAPEKWKTVLRQPMS